MSQITQTRFSDPEAFEAHMSNATAGASMSALNLRGFRANASLAVLPRTALFALEVESVAATRAASGDLWSVAIPHKGGFSVRVGGTPRPHHFGDDEAHLLHPDRDFHCRVPEQTGVLVANILSSDLQRKARALAGAAARPPGEIIARHDPAGGALMRFTRFLWVELQRDGGLWACPTAMAEMEDCLASLLALAASAPDPGRAKTPKSHALRRAEEHLIQRLAEPVSRAEVARAAGVSISTLSRGFRACHGVGPMAWLRARRLEAAHAELQAAAPGEVKVTDVAVRFGFEHLGRFSAEYLRTFGERPSETLMH